MRDILRALKYLKAADVSGKSVLGLYKCNLGSAS